MKEKMMREGDDDVENVGIMQGFMDHMNDDDEEDDSEEEGGEDGDYEDDGEEYSAEKITRDRRPDAPEILMNNLRGDMRSIDARRDELADLVGYSSACETPDSVLAMLQPILAARAPGAQGGIGALPESMAMAQGPQPPMPTPEPQGAPPMPAMEMAPPPQDGGIAALMAQQSAPTEQAPAQFARGGLVQGFAEGSDEDGVTPVQEAPSSYGISATPEMVERARTQFTNVLAQEPLAIPDLRAEAEKRAALYRDILGDNTQAQQAQMLMNLGQRAFGFAANVDDQGRALRGSFLSRLAGATRTLPGEMAQYIAASDEQQRKARMLGLQAAEKNIESTRTSNMKLLETQRKGYADILKAAEKAKDKGASGAGTGRIGKGDWEWGVVAEPRLMARFATGETTPDENDLILAARDKFLERRPETYTDPDSKQQTIVYRPGVVPTVMRDAFAARQRGGLSSQLPSTVALGNAPVGADVRTAALPGLGGPSVQGQGQEQAYAVAPGGNEPMPPQEPSAKKEPTLWELSGMIAGPVAAGKALLNRVPGLGGPFADVRYAQNYARQTTNSLVESLLKSSQGSVTEQTRLRSILNTDPSLFDPNSYGTDLIAIGSMVRERIARYDDESSRKPGTVGHGLSPDQRTKAREKAAFFREQYSRLGLPPVVNSEADFAKYPVGTKVLWRGYRLSKVGPAAPKE